MLMLWFLIQVMVYENIIDRAVEGEEENFAMRMVSPYLLTYLRTYIYIHTYMQYVKQYKHVLGHWVV